MADHKYIKREWVNGKWRYYYDDGKGGRKDLNVVSKIADVAGADEQTKAKMAKSRYLVSTGTKDVQSANIKTGFQLASANTDRQKKIANKNNDYYKKYSKSQSDYDHTVMGVAENGKNFLKKLFGK